MARTSSYRTMFLGVLLLISAVCSSARELQGTATTLSSHGDTLIQSQYLKLNSELISKNGLTRMVLQLDGNVVILHNGTQVYETATAGMLVDTLQMDPDYGTPQLLNGKGTLIEDVAPYASGSYPKRLIVQDDGNVILYDNDNQVLWVSSTRMEGVDQTPATPPIAGWVKIENAVPVEAPEVAFVAVPTPNPDDTRTSHGSTLVQSEFIRVNSDLVSCDGLTTLRLQYNGDLVLLHEGVKVWATDTPNIYIDALRLEPEYGELQLVRANGDIEVTVQGYTSGAKPTRLVVQNDGRAAVYTNENELVWITPASTQKVGAVATLPQPVIEGWQEIDHTELVAAPELPLNTTTWCAGYVAANGEADASTPLSESTSTATGSTPAGTDASVADSTASDAPAADSSAAGELAVTGATTSTTRVGTPSAPLPSAALNQQVGSAVAATCALAALFCTLL